MTSQSDPKTSSGAAGDGRVHDRAAHLLQGRQLPGDLLRDPRRRQVHRRVALDHPDPVGEGGHVGAAGRGRAEQAADLRYPAGQGDLQLEDARGTPAVGEETELVGEPAARGVDEVDHREQVTVGAFQDADLLLAGQLAPGTRLDGEVVRDDGHRPAVDASHSGPHAVGGQAVRGGVREQAVLPPAARVEQDGQAFGDRQLVRPAARVVSPAGRVDRGPHRAGPGGIILRGGGRRRSGDLTQAVPSPGSRAGSRRCRRRSAARGRRCSAARRASPPG